MLVVAILVLFCAAPGLAGKAEDYGIVPDIINKAPETVLQVKFSNGAEVNLGNTLLPSQVQEVPRFSWPAASGAFYTVAFVDPDAPSRQDPSLREYLHYLICNVPGSDTTKGLILAEYGGSAPPRDSGLHRYTFLVYKQLNTISFDTASPINRLNFNISKFALENGMGDMPVAYNFFQAENEDTHSDSNPGPRISGNVFIAIVYVSIAHVYFSLIID